MTPPYGTVLIDADGEAVMSLGFERHDQAATFRIGWHGRPLTGSLTGSHNYEVRWINPEDINRRSQSLFRGMVRWVPQEDE